MAMPAKDMMLEVMPIAAIGRKDSRTAIGIVKIGTIADGTCHRKRRMTRLTPKATPRPRPMKTLR
jgi:hypothetical protein